MCDTAGLMRHSAMSLRPPGAPTCPFTLPHTIPGCVCVDNTGGEWWCNFWGEVWQAPWFLSVWLLDFSLCLNQTVRSYGGGETEASDPMAGGETVDAFFPGPARLSEDDPLTSRLSSNKPLVRTTNQAYPNFWSAETARWLRNAGFKTLWLGTIICVSDSVR